MEEGMTDEQFRTFIKMIIQIIKDSNDKQDAVRKIGEMMNVSEGLCGEHCPFIAEQVIYHERS